MQPSTGKIFDIESGDQLKKLEKQFNEKFIPLTEKQVKILKPLSRRKRKFLMKHGSCICGSGKTFKKCCWKKYK